MIDFPTARIDIQTPRLTIQAAFTHYQNDIEQILRRELDKAVEDGSIVKAAIKELERQLPDYIKSRVSSALYSLDFGDVFKPILVAAFQAILEDKAK